MSRLSTLDHHFGGNKISQSWNDLFIWEQILNQYPPARILELGTFTGGMSVYLSVQARLRDADFTTFDIDTPEHIRVERFDSVFTSHSWDIGFHRADIRSPEGIELVTNTVNLHGRTILFCDNGAKEEEVRIYADKIKREDVLAVHDWGTECHSAPDILTMITPIDGIYQELDSLTRFFVRNDL